MAIGAETGSFEIDRDTIPGRPGISSGLSMAIDVLGAELEEAEGDDAATLGTVYLIGLGDPLAARGWLERALATREGFRAMLLCAVAAADRSALAQLGPRVARVSGERTAAARELAEVWLYHLRDPEAAAEVLTAAGAGGDDLTRVALALADMDAELEADLASGDAADMAAAAAVAWDLSGDDRAVLELAAGAGDELSLLELAVEIAAAVRDGGREIAALEALVEALERRDSGSPAAAALRFQLAERVAAAGDAGRAADLYGRLATGGGDEAVGPQLALRGQLRAAASAGDRPAVAAAYRELAGRAETAGDFELAAVYHRRAAQLSAGAEAARSWRAVLAAAPGDRSARVGLEVAGFRRGPAEHLETLRWLAAEVAGTRAAALRAAAAVADSALGDGELAGELIGQSLAADPRSELSQLQSLWSVALRDPDDGAAVVSAWLERAVEPPDSLLAGAAAMAINAGATELTLELVAAAARDSIALALAGAALADAGRWAELAETWTELVDALEAPRARRAIALELGRLAVTELGDLDRAQQAIAAAGDSGASPAAIAGLEAAVFRAGGDAAAAAAALERALAGIQPPGGGYSDSGTALSLLCELAEVALESGEPEKAATRIAEARKLAPHHGPVLELEVRAARATGDRAALQAALEARLEIAGDREERLELATEIAALTRAGGDDGAALEAYLGVLEIDPGQRAAIAGVVELGGGAGRWELVERALAAAPESAQVLEGRARALRQLERYPELVEVLERQLERSHSDAERADLATALAELYDDRLDEPETAVRLYREAATYSSGDPARRSALIAVLDAQGRWNELAGMLRSELERTRGPERVELALRLADTLRSRLGELREAAGVLESVLETAADPSPVLAALESIYDQTGQKAELLRVLERRAETSTDRPALLLRRIANLRGAAGDLDGALAAHAEAFAADPDDRATTAAIERLCHQHRRFGDLVDHYGAVLDRHDAPSERAEWLSRKGEIELRYLGNVGAALGSLTAAVELDPGRDQAFELATSVCTREGEWARLADLCVRRAGAIDGPERIELLRKAAQIAGRHLDDRERVRELDRKLLDQGERAPGVLDDIEGRARAAEDWELLALACERRLEHARGGDDTIALLEEIATIAAERLVDEKRAIDHYMRILEIAPSHRRTLESLARILEATEEWSRFLEVTERLIDLTADDGARALLLFKCGSVLEARFEDDERAIEYYRAAIEASVKCMPAVHGLRDLYRRRGDWEKVVDTLELETKLWTEPRERAGIYAQIGTIYATELGNPQRALDYFESALAVDPDSLPANLALFEHYFMTGNWKRALPLAERMSRKAVRAGDPRTRSEFYRRRGVVLCHSGRLPLAVDSVLVALEIDPENPRALDALLDLDAVISESPPAPNVADLSAALDELEAVYRRRDGAEPLLARVLVGRARAALRGGDLEGAGGKLSAALELAPAERSVVETYVSFRLDLGDAAGALAALESVSALWAISRRAEVLADVALDEPAARALWQRALEIDGDCLEALYRLAQSEYAAGDLEAAGVAIERAIDVAAAPGKKAAIGELARYYFLLGVIRQASGDDRAATAFRRAADYDPGYPEPSIALARRAVAAGDRDGAQSLLVSAAHRAMAERGKAGAVPLQRELARILAAAGDRAAASEAYRGILAVSPDPADRVALAEVHGVDDPSRAAAELESLLAECPTFGPAYDLAVSYHDRAGAPRRACRALSALAAVGMAGGDDLAALAARRRQVRWTPPQRPLTARQRGALLAGSPDPVLDRIYRELAPMLAERFPINFAGADIVGFDQVAGPAARAARAQIDAALGGPVELLIGRQVPGGIVAVSAPQPRAVIDIEIVEGPDPELRFAIGWAYEVVFRRYGPLACGPPERRRQVRALLRELIDEGGSEAPAVRALRAQLSPAIGSQLAGRPPGAVGVSEWADFALLVPCRAGLLFADDLGAAAAVLSRLAGHPVRTAPILPGADRRTASLVAYYLGAAHHRLHAAVCSPI